MRKRFQEMIAKNISIILFCLGIAALIASVCLDEFWSNFAQNLSSEMFGAWVTFLLLEKIFGSQKEAKEKAVANEEVKQQLRLELRSKDNATALNALDKCLDNQWNADGTLSSILPPSANLDNASLFGISLAEKELSGIKFKNAFLARVDFQGANLEFAEFQAARLVFVNLQNANIKYAKFGGSNLCGVNLVGADIEFSTFDETTILPDAQLELNARGVYDKYWSADTDMRRYTDPSHPDFWQPDWAKNQDAE